MFTPIFRNVALVASLFAGAANAKEDQFSLLASESMQNRLAPITDIFMKIAKSDVVILSASELFPNDLFTQRRMRAARGLEVPPTSFLPTEEILSAIRNLRGQYNIGYGSTTDLPSTLAENIIDLKDIQLFSLLYSASATASRMVKDDSEDTVCVVTPPLSSSRASAILASLAHLSNAQHPSIDPDITYEDIYHFVMLHEAAHCAQKLPKDLNEEEWAKLSEFEREVRLNIYSLERETEADEIAKSKMRQILEKAGRAPELANRIADAVEAARAIGTIRLGADLFDTIEYYPRHSTHVFETPPDFDYGAADVLLAAKSLTTLVNFSIGMSYGLLAAQSDLPNLKDFKAKSSMDILDALLDPLKTTDIGFAIADEIPEIQYGTVRAIRDIIKTNKLTETLFEADTGYFNTSFKIAFQMMENYLTGIETYYPEIAGNQLAIDTYDQAMELAANYTPSEATTEQSPDEATPLRDNPFSCFVKSLDPPANAEEALAYIRSIADFYQTYQIQMEIQHEMEMDRITKGLPPSSRPESTPCPS